MNLMAKLAAPRLFFYILYIIFILELLSYLALQFDLVSPPDSIDPQAISGSLEPIYVPHPYFGYVYNPSRRFFQRTWMQSNQEGFIDTELPVAAKAGECIWALLGGSGAMSWGVEKTEDRISYQLQELLNKHALSNKCQSYRVLNLGIGSHHLYQAAQIFIYYKHLLSGAIFYFGNNECSHPSLMAHTDAPLRFPEYSLSAILGADKATVQKIQKLRWFYGKIESFYASSALWKYSFFLKLARISAQNRILGKIQYFNSRLASAGPPEPLTDAFTLSVKKFDEQAYLYKDRELQLSIMNKAIDKLVKDPLLIAAAIAKQSHIPVLAAIQPMLATTDKTLLPSENSIRQPLYQQTCWRYILPDLLREVSIAGIPHLDLNSKQIFSKVKNEVFLDETHTTSAANKIIAQTIYQYMQKVRRP